MSVFSLVLPKKDPEQPVVDAVRALGGVYVKTMIYADPSSSKEVVVRFETVRAAIVAFRSLKSQFPSYLT